MSEWTALKRKTIEVREQHEASAAHAQRMMTGSAVTPARDPLALNCHIWKILPSLAINYVRQATGTVNRFSELQLQEFQSTPLFRHPTWITSIPELAE